MHTNIIAENVTTDSKLTHNGSKATQFRRVPACHTPVKIATNFRHSPQDSQNPRWDNASPPIKRQRGHHQPQNPAPQAAAGQKQGDKTESPPEGFIDTDEMLRRIPVCRKTLWSYCKAGKIPSVVLPGRTIFHWKSVETALLRQQKGVFQL